MLTGDDPFSPMSLHQSLIGLMHARRARLRTSGMRQATGLRHWFDHVGSIATPVLLLLAAMLPTVALFYLDMLPAAFDLGNVLTALSLVAMALSAVLVAVHLLRTRFRMRDLEIRSAQAIETAGLDPLSGLPNRLFFDRLLDGTIAEGKRSTPLALVSIDIDKFKSVNDAYGHQAGDRLIVGVAERIGRIVRDCDCLARVGGDELALKLVNVGDVTQCAAMAHRILDAMRTPFDIGSATVFVTLSLGIAFFPQDGTTREQLGQAADLALYRAKREGRNRFAFYDKTMEQKLRLGMTIEDDLRHAISADQLRLDYQPLVSACGTRMIGVEALVRWDHPRLGSMPPEDFIAVAESRGLIAPLGEWVLRRACSDARRWPGLRIAVNVSPVQFRQPGFVDKVRGIVAASGIEASRLDLELTEGVVVEDADQAEAIIMELRALGIRMAMDDFGSGYSSLIYLRRFAFDKIKIDRAFLGSLEPSGEGAIILDYIVSLGHALGLTVTAEGVEHEEQVAFLQKLGCDEMQGFYFAPPLAPEEIDARLSLDAWAGGRPPVRLVETAKARSAA